MPPNASKAARATTLHASYSAMSHGATSAFEPSASTACGPVVTQIRATGGHAIAVAADVSNENTVTAAVARVADELGPPTVSVNNAGITRDNLLFPMTSTDWDAVMGVHLRGAFLMSRATRNT